MKDWIILIVIIIVMSIMTAIGASYIVNRVSEVGLKNIIAPLWEGEEIR